MESASFSIWSRSDWHTIGILGAIIINFGDGVFTVVELPGLANASTRAVAAADINNDNQVDLIIAKHEQKDRRNELCTEPWHILQRVEILTNAGAGNYILSIAAEECIGDTGSAPDIVAIVAADVDQDSDVDLILACHRSASKLLTNSGSGSFGPPGAQLATCCDLPGAGLSTLTVAAADVTGDGIVDLVFGRQTNSNQLLTGSGNGSFAVSELPGGFYSTLGIAIGDTNSDGKHDLIFANTDTSNQLLMFTACTEAGTARSPAGYGCIICPSPASFSSHDSCFECEAHTQLGPDRSCAKCSAGWERSLGAAECQACAPGSMSLEPGTQCSQCSEGKSTSYPGSANCFECAARPVALGLRAPRFRLHPPLPPPFISRLP